MKTIYAIAFLLFTLSLAGTSHAQSGPPQFPDIFPLNAWFFEDTNFLSAYGDPHLSATNVDLVSTWDGNGLQVDSASPAFVNFNLIESDGWENLSLTNGSLRFWFLPNWLSTNLDGGTGPGNWGRLIDIGQWTSNASYGWWSLYLDPAGCNIYFSTQATNGTATNYLSAPISWDDATWHEIELTWSVTNSALYLDGAFATNGAGITVLPPPGVLTNGFFVGSDSTGTQQAHGQFDDLWTFSGPEDDTNAIANHFARYASVANPPRFHRDTDGTGGSEESPIDNIPSYGTNDFWLEILRLGTNAYNTDTNSVTLILHGTIADIDYQIQSTTNVQRSNTVWTVEQDILGSDVTNFTPTTVSMVGHPTRYFRALAYTQDSDGDGLPDWWENKYGLSPTNSDTGNTGIPDGYKQDSAGDGWNNLQKYQMGIAPGTWATPPPPRNVSARLDISGTNVILSWSSGGGPVDHYGIEYPGVTELATVNATTFVFTNNPDYQFLTNTSSSPSYAIRAYFTDGSHEDSEEVTVGKRSLSAEVRIIHGPMSQLYLAVASPPPNLSHIILFWSLPDDTINSTNIPASSLSNGIVALNQLTDLNGRFYYQFVDTNGDFGEQASELVNFPDYWGSYSFTNFTDARRHMKENLQFILRSAGLTLPFTYISNLGVPSNSPPAADYDGLFYPETYFGRPPTSTNYEYAGYRVYSSGFDYYTLNDLRPIQENYMWRNFVFDPTNFSGGILNTGAGQDSTFLLRELIDPMYQYAGSGTESPLPLAFSLTNNSWLYFNPNAAADIGLISVGTNYYLSSGVHNCFGLSLNSVHFGLDNVVSPGGLITNVDDQCFPNFAAPILNIVDYYFASDSRRDRFADASRPPMPGSPDFSVTNTSPLLMTSVGQPISLLGWAKEEILNGYSGKYAYLEQYFDKAYKMETNGTVTTNQTGILSPYGEFFPTEPGPTALVTMPDIDAANRGTCVVHVVKLQLDVNHDGTMDTSFAGPDNTSADRPYRFWVNNDCDGTGLGSEKNRPDHPDYKLNNIPSNRDLEDWSRLWICGLPILTSNYHVSLSWTNISSGSPSLNLVMPVETNGGKLYLTDTNIATSQSGGTSFFSASYKFANITPTNSYSFPVSFLKGNATNFLLFEGSGIGSGELLLTITEGTNVVTTSSAFIEFRDINDFFERSVITNITVGAISNWSSGIGRIEKAVVASASDSNIIVFVHGINNTETDWLSTSATMYKRLFWSGYQGIFASVKWPCKFLPFNAAHPFDFNLSEFYAYKSAPAFKDYLSGFRSRFPAGNIHIVAHSQGNAVASEALLQGATFDTYILTQAAMPAGSYDPNAPTNADLLYADTPPGGERTPFMAPMGYQGIYTNLTGRIVNFYNTNDYALGWWVSNQRLSKPDGTFGARNYTFDGTNGFAVIGESTFRLVTDQEESRGMISRSHTVAIGAQGPATGLTSQGVIGSSVNLGAEFGFFDTRPEHSAEFARPIQTTLPYYSQVLRSCLIQP